MMPLADNSLEEKKQIWNALKAYCKLDTFFMVEI